MPNKTSERLARCQYQIMTAWEERATREVLAAVGLPSLALRDTLPELLTQIVTALSTQIDRTAVRVKWDREESARVGKKHGHERADSRAYTMDQMIFEYHILRQVICDVMEEEVPLSAVEREVIVCAVEQAVNDAATQFSDTIKDVQEVLASSLTHDLRGPMTSAKINAQMILRRPENDEYCSKAAKRIVCNMDRLDAMIHDLLDASLIRAGQPFPLTREVVDLELMAVDVAEEMNLIYGNRFVVMSRAPAWGQWSKPKLRRVIENLVTNAAKYGVPNTPITLTLEQDEHQVSLRVHNEGKGLTEDEQKVLFRRFHRTKSAANPQAGWGVGLTVVKGVVEAHQGQVRVESDQGQGTSFIIELPKNVKHGNP